jgi:N-acetylneuraminic acid mutarotase
MRRVLRLLAAVPLMVLLVVGVVLLVLFATNPDPRESPGWTVMAPMPEPRGETTTAVLEDRLYVISGLSGVVAGASATVSVYDPATDAWTDGPALPDPRHHAGAATLDGAIYLAGGAPSVRDWSPETNLWRLDAGAEAWTDLAPMPEGRYGHRLVALDGRLWVVGGVGGSGATLVYDPAIDAWETRAPLPENRDHLGVVVVDGEIWAIAGRNGGVRTSVDLYDPATDAWRPGPALPAPTSGAAEAATSDGLVLVSGGEDPAPVGDGVFDRHWWLDARAADLTWRELPRPPLAIHGVEGAVIDGRYYVVGGATRAGGQSFVSWTDATQAFDLATLDR